MAGYYLSFAKCHRKYRKYGIVDESNILFLDILTPSPTLGMELDMVGGIGPVLSTPMESEADIKCLGGCPECRF
jgi:uroporphyrinogen decarboxylase